MKLETYLDAMNVAYYRWLDAQSSEYTDRKYRQYKKFRQRIIEMYDYPFNNIKWASKVTDLLGGSDAPSSE